MSKLNLPSSQNDSVAPAVIPEVFSGGDEAGRTVADQIGSVTTAQSGVVKAHADVAKSRLAVQQEALKTVQSVLGVVEQFARTQATKAEWEGRVETAKQKVEEAKVGLDKARERTEQVKQAGVQQTERIAALADARNLLLTFLQQMLDQSSRPDTTPEERARLQKQIAESARDLTKLSV